MAKKERRIHEILEIISKNPEITRDEIHQKLIDQKIARKTPYDLLGEDSEIRTVEALTSLSFITHIEPTERHSLPDSEGIDALVYFSGIEPVALQIKSSIKGMKLYMRQKKLTIDMLLTKKSILLNGQDDYDTIRQNFLMRLAALDSFWTNEHNTPILSASERQQLANYLL